MDLYITDQERNTRIRQIWENALAVTGGATHAIYAWGDVSRKYDVLGVTGVHKVDPLDPDQGYYYNSGYIKTVIGDYIQEDTWPQSIDSLAVYGSRTFDPWFRPIHGAHIQKSGHHTMFESFKGYNSQYLIRAYYSFDAEDIEAYATLDLGSLIDEFYAHLLDEYSTEIDAFIDLISFDTQYDLDWFDSHSAPYTDEERKRFIEYMYYPTVSGMYHYP